MSHLSVCRTSIGQYQLIQRVKSVWGSLCGPMAQATWSGFLAPPRPDPLSYPFGPETTYAQILQDLLDSNTPDIYLSSGIIDLLDRNSKVKPSPEQWQQEHFREFDLVISFTNRSFLSILRSLRSTSLATTTTGVATETVTPTQTETTDAGRTIPTGHQVHLINLETRDDPKTADEVANHVIDLVERCNAMYVAAAHRRTTGSPTPQAESRVDSGTDGEGEGAGDNTQGHGLRQVIGSNRLGRHH